jgi:tetratricopeptide (TPR) repeat protein
MVVRVVSVETSEIIASVDKEAKPEYFKMEKELVEELAKKLDITLSDDVKALIKEGGTESLDATTFYSKGLEYMDRYDYKKAYEFFKKAYDLDNSFVEAKRKMEIYQPLAS